MFEAPAWPLSALIDWITGDAKQPTLAELVADLLPIPTDDELMGIPWLRSAWETPGIPKTAACIRLAQLQDDWLDAAPDDFDALEVWAHRLAIGLRRTLTHHADVCDIAEALATLADVLGQDVRPQTAAFIIETIDQARLTPFVVNAVCRRVALIETGRIKPAPFARLIEPARLRLTQAQRAAGDAAAFERHVIEGLAYLRDQLAGEQSAAPPMLRQVTR